MALKTRRRSRKKTGGKPRRRTRKKRVGKRRKKTCKKRGGKRRRRTRKKRGGQPPNKKKKKQKKEEESEGSEGSSSEPPKEKPTSRSESDHCPICQEIVTKRGAGQHGLNLELECGHTFHMHCIRKWIEQEDEKNFPNYTCPMCRGVITDADVKKIKSLPATRSESNRGKEDLESHYEQTFDDVFNQVGVRTKRFRGTAEYDNLFNRIFSIRFDDTVSLQLQILRGFRSHLTDLRRLDPTLDSPFIRALSHDIIYFSFDWWQN